MINLTIDLQQIIAFIFALIITLVFLFLVANFVVFKRLRSLQHALTENGFFIFEMESSLIKNVLQTFGLITFASIPGSAALSDNGFFKKVQAKTIKNKELLIVQEKSENLPKDRVVLVLKDPKLTFPSFRLSRTVPSYISVPRKVEERDITKYFQISSKDQSLLVSKLQLPSLKRHYRKVIRQIFDIELDQNLHLLTIKSPANRTSIQQVLSFLMALDTELEDYTGGPSTSTAEESKVDQKPEFSYAHIIRITNSMSLVNISNIKVQCTICWSKINYDKETLLFECCSGYCHYDHGVDWLEKNHKCPRCGATEPYVIELPP